MVKYSGFAEKRAYSQEFMGINPKYLTIAQPGGISCEISSFRNSHSLLGLREGGHNLFRKGVSFMSVQGPRFMVYSS